MLSSRLFLPVLLLVAMGCDDQLFPILPPEAKSEDGRERRKARPFAEGEPDAGVPAERDAGTRESPPPATDDDEPPEEPPAAEPGCVVHDSDGDGVPDEVELALGSGANDASSSPEVPYFVAWPSGPSPASHTLEATAELRRADVVFLLDTTGSMYGVALGMAAGIAEMIATLAGEVDDLAFALAGFGDLPTYSARNDVPFYLVHRMMTARTPEGLASLVDATEVRNIVGNGVGPWFAIMNGGDLPEHVWEGLRQTATGEGLLYPLHDTTALTEMVPPFWGQTAHPPSIPAGEEVGTLGGVGFRAGAQPIVVLITDTIATDPEDYWTPTSPPQPDHTLVLAELAALNARVVGVNAAMGWEVQEQLVQLAVDTGAVATPALWGEGEERPTGCGPGACCVDARSPPSPAEAPLDDDGVCELAFRTGQYQPPLGRILTEAILGIARGSHWRIDATVEDVDGGAALLDDVEAVACGGGAAVDEDGDGDGDVLVDVPGGSAVCFRLRASAAAAPASSWEQKTARVLLEADGQSVIAEREVHIFVPPCEGP